MKKFDYSVTATHVGLVFITGHATSEIPETRKDKVKDEMGNPNRPVHHILEDSSPLSNIH